MATCSAAGQTCCSPTSAGLAQTGREPSHGAELWRRLRVAGFGGGLRIVPEWATRRRRSERSRLEGSRRTPPARLLSRLMMMRRDHMSKADAIMVAAVGIGVPAWVTARDWLARCPCMLRARDTHAIAPWRTDIEGGLIAPFGKGIRADFAAVRPLPTLVERPDRGTDHNTQAVEVTDVWPRKARSAPRKTTCTNMTDTVPRLSQSPLCVPIDKRGRLRIGKVWCVRALSSVSDAS
jgi:hypothetical protein